MRDPETIQAGGRPGLDEDRDHHKAGEENHGAIHPGQASGSSSRMAASMLGFRRYVRATRRCAFGW